MTDEQFEKVFMVALKNAAVDTDFARLEESQRNSIKAAIKASMSAKFFGAHRLQALVQTFSREHDRAEANR